MARRFVACAVLAVGCGRIAFDSHATGTSDGASDSDAAGPALGPLAFPAGGSIYGFAFAPDGSARYALTQRTIYRSTDGKAWTACGTQRAHAIAVDSGGAVFCATDTTVYRSTDGCATWQPTPAAHYTKALSVVGSTLYGMTDAGLYTLPPPGVGWVKVTTPLDNDFLRSLSASASGMEIVVGSDAKGAIRSANGGATWAPASGGLVTLEVVQLAISPQDPLRAYAIEGGTSSLQADVACSLDGGASWSTCYGSGGESIAVDPTNKLHVLAGVYDNLVSTTDGFASATNDVRGHDLDQSRIHAVAFTPSGVPVVGSDRGIFDAADAGLAWVGHQIGLDAWSVLGITVDGEDIYASTHGGPLASVGGEAFTLGTTGMTGNTSTGAVLVTRDPAALISVGLSIRRSDDRGHTWTELRSMTGADSYFATSVVQLGTRLIVGTMGRTLTADPPWTTWTPRAIAGAPHLVNALLLRDGAVWAATDDGLYESLDQGVTYVRIAAVTGSVQTLALTPDDRIIAGTDATAWLSDATATAWQPTSLAAVVFGLAARGDAIVAATDAGVRVTHDAGITWTTVPGFDGLWPLSVAFEAGGTLLVGADGTGLTRVAPP